MKRKQTTLKRELGLLEVFCIASGAMISSGIFILPAIAYTMAGPSVVFAYILAGLLALPAMLTKAELSTAMPKAGGVYFFVERSMGTPVGTVGGLASWFSLSFKSAFALIGMGVFATLINPALTEIQIKLIAVGFCLFFMFVNIIGVKVTGRFQVAMVLALIGVLLFYIIRGFQFVDPEKYVPFAPNGPAAVFATAGLVFVSFGGLTKISAAGEEVKNPGKNIPLGMFLAFAVVMFIYVAAVFVTIGLLGSQQLSSSLMPLSLGAGTFAGRAGSVILAFAAILAFVTTANAGILTASRSAMAMSRDFLLPGFLQKVNAKTKTPYFAIVLTSAFMIAVIMFLSLKDLVKTASTLMILLFFLVNVSLIAMRESKIQSYRPQFRAPLYPWLQVFGIIGYGYLIVKMGEKPLAITAIFVACALAWYFLYARTRVDRRAALVHVIERITARELAEPTLPDELREIIIERDEIIEDRFDQIIKKCEIIECEPSKERKCTAEDVFKKAADILSKRLDTDKKKLHDLLLEREKESSTVITPGLAIPHIIVEGKKKFDILIIRSKDGIVFPEVSKPVHALFILIGSQDERNFHLRALAAIAQIAQDKNFNKNWREARNTDELRDLILLAERKRVGTA